MRRADVTPHIGKVGAAKEPPKQGDRQKRHGSCANSGRQNMGPGKLTQYIRLITDDARSSCVRLPPRKRPCKMRGLPGTRVSLISPS